MSAGGNLHRNLHHDGRQLATLEGAGCARLVQVRCRSRCRLVESDISLGMRKAPVSGAGVATYSKTDPKREGKLPCKGKQKTYRVTIGTTCYTCTAPHTSGARVERKAHGRNGNPGHIRRRSVSGDRTPYPPTLYPQFRARPRREEPGDVTGGTARDDGAGENVGG